DLSESQLATLHRRVVERIQAGGEFWIGTTELKGRTWFRACIVNFRTTLAQIERLMELLEQECARAERELAGG
ncbi:MAG TPA: hypothetical protein VKA53_06375, partial [Thermoanaerobaculia bacterium]|nr:hypothetical protein [Thermoanaerobaculia bacterium]